MESMTGCCNVHLTDVPASGGTMGSVALIVVPALGWACSLGLGIYTNGGWGRRGGVRVDADTLWYH
jgi:hypothetical protein